MKHKLLSFLCLASFLVSCGPSAEEKIAMEKCRQQEKNEEALIKAGLISMFDAPFPKRNRNLSAILGDTLRIRGKCMPLTFRIVSSKKQNFIIEIQTGDTLFKGKVSKHRELYYFSEQVNDTSFRIFAWNITDSLIYGLQHYIQYAQVDSMILKAKHPKLVQFIDKNKHTIRLRPEKKELRKLFTSLLADTEPFEIIQPTPYSSSHQPEQTPAFAEADDFELLSKVYPNPVTDILTIELHEKSRATPYYLSDLNGKIILKGILHGISNKFDISHLPNGMYILTLTSSDEETETIKIVKTK